MASASRRKLAAYRERMNKKLWRFSTQSVEQHSGHPGVTGEKPDRTAQTTQTQQTALPIIRSAHLLAEATILVDHETATNSKRL